MRVENLNLKQFRNIAELDLHCPEELHLFVGPNAQGKTNILESLYLLALGKSHRTRTHRELIRFGEKRAVAKASVRKGEQKLRLEVQMTEKGKKVSRNGIEQPRLSQYIGSLPAVLFAPEDLALVKGSPQIRRRFLDMEIGQVSPAYVHHLTQLNKLLTQRNSLLKQLGQKGTFQSALLNVLDEQFIQFSIDLWKKRLAFLSSLKKWARGIHQAITRGLEELEIEYLPSLPSLLDTDPGEWPLLLQRELEKKREKEIRRGTTLIGPQRDDLRLTANGLDLHLYGSQGQQRTAALSLKLAEIELIYQETGYYPVLLLDDVLSELDDSRKTHLLEAIRGRVQTFVTTTNLEGIDQETLAKARIYQVRQGRITELG
ncbi:DNA replication/repair protein RecF [Thermoactinomyces sp. CICC 10521]|uniref:DNA replication and repair protein RecF n=1 Tax=Thermoactinomyces daqus TaxID=1329516 RepID=A0A7W1X8B8_9BACL|nr:MULTISPECIES: DNA replication/repair protein RecF [unclassified Thermoactinomyces]MBA4541941.1 DNA replication/repair protein RecF [Thermoactinomyces daqus]MBH8604293.1 DNA replication/repair protein RecF [Thermoactinomyces sp. CICC 10522]MBH8607748.1 DNA replication/repair protein RecF [Thermoactinomyces sp. CICC 10521]